VIIQSLVALYERLAESQDPDLRLPEPGWQEREIAFVIDLGPAGQPVNVMPLRQAQPKGRARAPLRLVPQEVKRTGKIPDQATEKDSGKASLFWDNPRYALGLPAGDDTKSARDADVMGSSSYAIYNLRGMPEPMSRTMPVCERCCVSSIKARQARSRLWPPTSSERSRPRLAKWRSGCTATWT
jgi:hypothetical protein